MPRAMSESAKTMDWLLPEEAATTAYDLFRFASTERGDSQRSSYTVDDRSLWLPRVDSPSPKEWDYWNEMSLFSDIPKIQARPAPGTYESPGNDSRAVYAILDYGLFWIGTDVQPDGTYFGAGYDYLIEHRYRLPAGSVQPEFLVPNATWRGDALGMEKASGNPVWGPAALTMTSIATSPADGFSYSLQLDVVFLKDDGVDRVELGTSGSDGAFGGELQAGTEYRIEGTFLGPRAQEASGIFETPAYYGALGVKR